jgi:hypothetical protein
MDRLERGSEFLDLPLMFWTFSDRCLDVGLFGRIKLAVGIRHQLLI